ncbi:GHMP kinase [candidate division KSB1 bacterium]|nr:GHMP kinase [candidate division KSB1 bacterium]
MYQIAQGTTHGLEDVKHFIDIINTLGQNSVPEARSLFDPEHEILVTRAPGRLDVMGGIADYSGSLVLQLPLKEATVAAIQLNPNRRLRIVSLSPKENGRSPHFEMALDDFEEAGSPLDYQSAQKYFRKNAATAWAAYAAGAFLVLLKEKNARFKNGARILIYSKVPEGKGVSSSAALEVAVMAAVTAAFKIKIPPPELAVLCQKVENLVVGAPCGIMDQMASACGKAGQLLSLLCQPAILQEPVGIPNHISFWGIDSGVSHSVVGADYTSVRVGAFMGYRLIAGLAGLVVSSGKHEQQVCINDTKWNGYLANITPSVYEHYYAAHLPDEINGSSFIERYQGTTDEVTEIKPDGVYKIARPTTHPIYEHFRVRTFAELLQNPKRERALEQLGELMYQSHGSYSACGLGSEGTDRLVEHARRLGPKKGIFGAKITGGGSGGTVALLGEANAYQSIVEIGERYAEETNHEPQIFSGSSMGADDFGRLILKNTIQPRFTNP